MTGMLGVNALGLVLKQEHLKRCTGYHAALIKVLFLGGTLVGVRLTSHDEKMENVGLIRIRN